MSRMVSFVRHARLPLAALSGFILVTAFPGWNIESVVWLWMLPLLAALWLGELPVTSATSRWKRWWHQAFTFRLGWLAGMCFFVPNLSWLRHSSRVINGATGMEWMGWPVELMGWGAVAGMSLVLSSYVGLWAAFVAKIARPRLAAFRYGNMVEASWESIRCAGLSAGAWASLEWVRGWLFTGFGWNGLAVALHRNKVLIQAADLVGVSGLSFTVMFCSCMLFLVVLRFIVQSQGGKRLRYHFDALTAVLLLAAQMVYGIQQMKRTDADTIPLRVVLVQGNVPQMDVFSRANFQAHYQRYAELTQLMVEPRGNDTMGYFDLVVWPESALALPWDHASHEPFFDPLLKMSDFTLLAGCDDRPVAGDGHTGAVMMNKAFNGAQTYWKVHLVPFGEYLPIRWLLGPVLGGVLPGDFRPGQIIEPLPMQNSPVQVIPLVCFEDTVGDLARRFIRDEPQVLVNLTNDGWFLQSAEPEQHLNNAIFRAIELRRPLCRATNTGVTSFIDERGQVLATLRDPDTGSTFIEGTLPQTVQVPKHPQSTIYARWGDWFAMLSMIVCAITLILHWRQQRDTSHSAPVAQA